MAHAETVAGNTGCLYLRGTCIPYYDLGERTWILMDSGSRYDREELFGLLEENGVAVRAVLCSHAHFDHTENNRELQKRYGAEIIMTPFDAGCLRDQTSLKACFYSYTGEDNARFRGEMLCRADRVLAPGQEQVEVGGVCFRILPLPGHAASHVGYVTPDGVCYLADALLSGQVLTSGRLPYMLDWVGTLHTAGRIRELNYPYYILAHCGAYTDVDGLAEENLRHFGGLLDDFAEIFAEPAGLDEAVRRAVKKYGCTIKNFEKACTFERVVRSATEYLSEQGKISREIEDGIVVYRLR